MFKQMRFFKYFVSEKFPSLKVEILFIYLFTMSYVGFSKAENSKYDLLLAGGGLKTCSSLATKNCTKNVFTNSVKTQALYRLSEKNIAKFLNTLPVSEISHLEKMNIKEVVEHIYSIRKDGVLDKSALRKLFDEAGYLSFYQQLDDPLYYALLDSLEMAQMDENGLRKREVTSLQHNKNNASVSLYQAFVEQAKMRIPDTQSKPRIAVVTASSRDPFEVADFYLSVFEDAGAEVIWLPLDKTYRQAQELGQWMSSPCQKLSLLRARNNSFYRENIYPLRVQKQDDYCQSPDKMLQDIASVQGIFFNGGDQSLTLAALKNSDGSDSEELAFIRAQVGQGKLIVGGTSAGTAVQGGGAFNGRPIPMITNGHSKRAMERGIFASPPPSQRCLKGDVCGQGILTDDLTYRPQGGTGLFELGILDTHFSERDRETRLAMFVHGSGQRFGFGVDEATALLVKNDKQHHRIKLSVLGQGGVFVVDTKTGHLTKRQGLPVDSEHSTELSSISHYLSSGASAIYNVNNDLMTFNLPGEKLTRRQKVEVEEPGNWRVQTALHCGSSNAFGWQQFSNNYRLQPSSVTAFHYDQSLNLCAYSHLPFAIVYTQSE